MKKKNNVQLVRKKVVAKKNRWNKKKKPWTGKKPKIVLWGKCSFSSQRVHRHRAYCARGLGGTNSSRMSNMSMRSAANEWQTNEWINKFQLKNKTKWICSFAAWLRSASDLRAVVDVGCVLWASQLEGRRGGVCVCVYVTLLISFSLLMRVSVCVCVVYRVYVHYSVSWCRTSVLHLE